MSGAAVGLLATGGPSIVTSLPAAAAVRASGVPGDVNGDGYAEVAVSEKGRLSSKGAVHVFYGRPAGLTTRAAGKALDDQYLDQAEPGVPGSGANYGDFGTDSEFGDFNDDGCADLAVGAVNDGPAGSLYVFYGSPSGLKTSGSVRFTSAQAFGTPPGTQADAFGAVLAAGDLNHDGVADLAVGAPFRQVGPEPLSGAVVAFFGGSSGLSPSSSTILDRDSAEVTGFDAGSFGSDLVVGDFNGNDVAELAIHVSSGAVQVLEGAASGFTPAQSQPLSGPRLGVDDLVIGDDGEEDARVFGGVVAAGDVDADGDDDLAVGMPSLTCRTCADAPTRAGVVLLVKGSDQGLTSSGMQTWTQDSSGVVGQSAEEDSFGSRLAMGRLDPGATDDLAIGTPYDSVGSKRRVGSVTILLGSSSGLTTAGAGGARFSQDTAGVAGSAEELDTFGSALTIANVQGASQGSLVIGARREKIGSRTDAGQIHQLSRSSTGPTGRGSVSLHLDSSGVKGILRSFAEFGGSLS